MLNLIDVLATGPRPGSPVELTLSALFAYDWSSLYQTLRRAEEQLAETIDYDRPKTRTVEVGYVHGADGMKPGHALSLLGERVGEGSWTLPLEIAWFSPQADPLSFGAAQLEQFVSQHGWSADQALAYGCIFEQRDRISVRKKKRGNEKSMS